MSRVWAMFSDRTASTVVMDEIAAAEDTDLKLVSVGIDNLQVKNSSEKAIRAAFKVLKRDKSDGIGKGYSYEFSDLETVIHSSASLAFALKLVQKVKNIPFSLAATGVILDSSPVSPVERVDNINEKIIGAFRKLEPGDRIYFPGENLSEISEENRKTANEKGIVLQPVKTVEDAVCKVLDRDTGVSQNNVPGNQGSAIALFLLASVFFLILTSLFLIPGDYLKILNIEDKPADTNIKKPVNDIRPAPATDIKKPVNDVSPLTAKIITDHKHSPAVEKVRQLRFRIDISGQDTRITSALADNIAVILGKQDFIINNENYDGIISGNVSLTGREEIPLQPYAPLSAIVVRMNLVLDSMEIRMKNGDIHEMGMFSVPIEVTKDQENSIFSDGSKMLAEKIDNMHNISELLGIKNNNSE
ncbi:MAG: hypothetical protein GY749_40990 [Desulfobacteraceae bacterium]|nr:hypothetical protein [Desulfobacteraceae bacterium]